MSDKVVNLDDFRIVAENKAANASLLDMDVFSESKEDRAQEIQDFVMINLIQNLIDSGLDHDNWEFDNDMGIVTNFVKAAIDRQLGVDTELTKALALTSKRPTKDK